MHLHSYSTALFSTWHFLEEIGLLLDCGDGCSSHLLQKSRKIKHIFISHPDRDHVCGLLQLNQLNVRGDYPVVYYPADSSSFPNLHAFSKRFDPQLSFPEWIAVRPGEEIEVHADYVVRCIRNEHVAVPPDVCKSLSFLLYRKKKKLKAEYLSLSGKEIASLKKNSTEDISEIHYEPVLAYSADTPVEHDGRYHNFPVLIHEATFLNREDVEDKPEKNKHSFLEEVMEMVSASEIQRLILAHFSPRYSKQEIDSRIHELAIKHSITIPVDVIYPGEVSRFEF